MIVDGDDGAPQARQNQPAQVGYPGSGYGAGGFGGRNDTSTSAYYQLKGGTGAPGLFYIEWSDQ